MDSSACQEAIKVVIVDDHPLALEALRLMLCKCRNIEVVGEAGTCDDATAVIQSCEPDVVLLDYSLPDGTAADVVAWMRRNGSTAHALVMSGYVDEAHVCAAVREGAAGYLWKTTVDQRSLTQAICRVAEGHTVFSDDAMDILTVMLRGDSTGSDLLTEREREVWGLMALGIDNREIASRLYVAERTAKFHVSRIMQKLGATTRAEVIAYAHLSGFFLSRNGQLASDAGCQRLTGMEPRVRVVPTAQERW